MVLLAAALGSAVACGGGGDSKDTDGSGGRGGAGSQGGKGGAATGGTTTGLGWPASLPGNTAACASATGADGCYFDGCCAELVACAKNADCATTYGCYVTCPITDANCFVTCAGSALEGGSDDFAAATECLAPLTASCGRSSGGGTGGSGSGGGTGSGGDGGAGSGDVGPLGTAKDSLGWDLNVASKPLVAELEPDAARAVSQTVTSAGGTITAKAADGTTFELAIPEGALWEPTLITLTPLASLAVPPLDGPAYGVQIAPDGLALMGSPTLSITPAKGEDWPIDQQVPLAIAGGDQTAALALIEPSSTTLELVLNHFSSYGVLLSQKGFSATLSAADIRSRFAGDVVDRLQSAAAERLGKERVSQLLGGQADDKNLASVMDLFNEYEEHVVKPRVAKAGESCAAGKLAFQTATGFERSLMLLGVEDRNFAFDELLATVSEVCVREEYELCRDHHIITRLIPVMLSVWRQAQLLGAGDIPPDYVMKAEGYVRSCLKFELAFDSDVLYSDDAYLSMKETVTARVPFQYDASFTIPTELLPPHAAETGAIIGGSMEPLESSAYSVSTTEQCLTIDAEEGAAGELGVITAGFEAKDPTEELPWINPELKDFSIAVALNPNLSKYQFTSLEQKDVGCGSAVANGEEFLSWSSTLGSYLLSQYTTEEGPLFKQWDVPNDGGQIIAVKDIFLNGTDGGTFRGPVNMVILHTPE